MSSCPYCGARANESSCLYCGVRATNKEHKDDPVFRLREALRVIQYPKDFEAACKMAHEVRK